MDGGIARPVADGSVAVEDGGTVTQPIVTTRTDADGNFVTEYDWGDSQTVWKDEEAVVSQPEQGMDEPDPDPGPTPTPAPTPAPDLKPTPPDPTAPEPMAPVDDRPADAPKVQNPVDASGPAADARPTLVQTGQLNWPVPVLADSGTVLVAVGLYRVSRSRRRDDRAE